MDSAFWTQIMSFKVNQHAGLDADFGDKVNYLLTSTILVVMTLVLSIRYFCGKVIACWCPSEFSVSQVEYTENYCWVMSTWRYNFSAYYVPQSHEERDALRLNYYQWIPFMLVVCSLMFHAPLLFYRMMNWNSGIKVFQIMKLAVDVDMTQDKNDRDGSVLFIARYLRQALVAQTRIPHGCFANCKQSAANACFWCGKHYGNYLVFLYFFCKLLYLANAVSQFFIMYSFLGARHTAWYGFEYLSSFISGRNSDEIDAFPRQTWCDFTIKRLYNDNRYTVQCLLPINLFAEKLFLFLWFWYVFVTLCTAYSIIAWLWRVVFRTRRIRFVKNYLLLTGTVTHRESSLNAAIARFVDKELRYDGVFLLQFISMNCGELVCAEVISKMWRMHRGAQRESSAAIEPNVALREGRHNKQSSSHSSSPINNNDISDV